MSFLGIAHRSTLRLDGRLSFELARARDDVEYAAGDVIADRYRLSTLLGSGGMGVVWRARDLVTSAPVAIKIAVRSRHCFELISRMQAEAELEMQLQHPGIVRALDFGLTPSGDAFIAMELLQGSSLRQVLAERGRLLPEEAAQLLLPIADALCFVHSAGVIHRDIKPDNLFVATGELGTQPKLLDFGIAKRVDRRSQTCEGLLVGSPGYMAPEQARAQADVDARADIWAFCLVLYEAVAGMSALHQPDLATVLPHEAFTVDVRPSLADVGGSEALLSVLERGLAQKRERRFQSMSELARALRAALPAKPRRRRQISYPLAA